MTSIANSQDKPRRDFPEGPMRQHDPDPDRISRTDTNPAPNSIPVVPSHPKPLPSTNPPSF